MTHSSKIITLFAISCMVSTSFSQENYELLYMKGEYEQLTTLADKLSDAEDYYWNALMKSKNGDAINAIVMLEKGRELYPEEDDILKLLAKNYFETGQYTKAKPLLLRYSDELPYFFQYIKVLEFEEAYSEAIDKLQVCLRTDSNNVECIKLLGENYIRIDSMGLAGKSFERILALNPDDMIIANKLASLYLKQKRYAEAIEICSSVLYSDSTNKRFIKLRAMGYFNLPLYENAATDFRNLYQHGDSSKFVLKHLGISEFNTNEFGDARAHLLLAFQLDSTDYETSFFLGKAYLNSPYPEKGLYYFNRTDSLLQPDPKIISAIYIEKQSVYSTLEQYRNALHCYREAYKNNPKPEYIFFSASMYEHKLNNKQKAYAYYQKFLEVLPEAPETAIEDMGKQKQVTISLKRVAEERVKFLKEELFFEGVNVD